MDPLNLAAALPHASITDAILDPIVNAATDFIDAVGLVGVVALLFLVDVLDTWPMLVVIPLLSAAAFLASWWITTTYVEPSA